LVLPSDDQQLKAWIALVKEIGNGAAFLSLEPEKIVSMR
jgi:hypothetical protein